MDSVHLRRTPTTASTRLVSKCLKIIQIEERRSQKPQLEINHVRIRERCPVLRGKSVAFPLLRHVVEERAQVFTRTRGSLVAKVYARHRLVVGRMVQLFLGAVAIRTPGTIRTSLLVVGGV